MCCSYLAADCVLVPSAPLQDGLEWMEGLRRTPCVLRLPVNVRNLELDRRENVSDVLLRLETRAQRTENVMLLLQVKALVVFGSCCGGETTLHLLVGHVRGAGLLARPRSHAAPGAVRRAVAVEVEAVREGRLVEEVGGQIVVKIWEKEEREKPSVFPWTS